MAANRRRLAASTTRYHEGSSHAIARTVQYRNQLDAFEAVYRIERPWLNPA